MNAFCPSTSIELLSSKTVSEVCDTHRACRTVFETSGISWLEPVQISASMIANAATSPTVMARVLEIMDELTEDEYLLYLREYYRVGIEKFAPYWGYADLLTFLYASATLIEPRNYLEIGVRRGRSLAVIASKCPSCQLFGFDMWMADYAGMPNPGPNFVSDELRRIGFQGKLELISGDSHETVPAFLAQNSNLMFDLINVDGDHSEQGARADLETVLPRLCVGGAVVLDDIIHPQHPYLENVWDSLIGSDSNFSSVKYRDLGYGVAIAIRNR